MLRNGLLSLFAATLALGQSGHPDPAFNDIPFDEWLKGGSQAPIQWVLRVGPPHLSEYQRLQTSVDTPVDGSEFIKRPEPGRMMLFIQIQDQANSTYRAHRTLSLKERTIPPDLARVKLFETICIQPGDYEVAAAVYDTKTKEHSLKKVRLRVPKLGHDPLPGAWLNRPSVEISRFCNSRDSAPLFLPLETEKSVRIDVIVNRPTSPFATPHLTERLDVISEMRISNGSMELTAIDLHSRKVRTQSIAGNLDMRRIWAGFPRDARQVVDVRQLENGKEAAQFFLSQVRKLLEVSVTEQRRALIALSTPMNFPKDADLSPIQITRHAGTLVFYIRCNTIHSGPGPSGLALPPSPGDLSLPSGPVTPSHHVASNSDSLEKTLKPLDPKLFDVWTPIQFRQALATIMREIGANSATLP